jgi:hypothetical protein
MNGRGLVDDLSGWGSAYYLAFRARRLVLEEDQMACSSGIWSRFKVVLREYKKVDWPLRYWRDIGYQGEGRHHVSEVGGCQIVLVCMANVQYKEDI